MIDSVGYEETVTYADWAELTSHLGARYSVFGPDAFAASAGAGDRQVMIAVGPAAGVGILDEASDVMSVTGGPVSSGSRYDMIVLRRNWSTKTTSLVLIPGTSAKALPSRSTTPGVQDDQPLWLVRFTAGQTAVQEYVDLRCWHGDGGIVARDLLARDYLDRIGTVLRIADTTWVRAFSGLGVPTWVEANASWATLTGKPNTFSPAAHRHDIIDISQDGNPIFTHYLPQTFYNKAQVNTLLAARVDWASLTSGLDGKSNTGHTHDDRYFTESEADQRFVHDISPANTIQMHYSGGRVVVRVDATDFPMANTGDLNGKAPYNAYDGLFSGVPYGREITWTRRSGWIGDGGQLGYAPSTAATKQDITPAGLAREALTLIPIVQYRYIAEVAKQDEDSDYQAATEIGSLADTLHELGLWQFVVYEGRGDDAVPVSIHYELLGLAALALAQILATEIDTLTGALADLADRVAALEP